MSDYYSDSVNGNDANSGLSELLPKLTLTQINALTGDQSGNTVYLARGSHFREKLFFPAASVLYGSYNNLFKVTAYGSGALPIIDGSILCTGFTQDLTTDPLGRLWKKESQALDADIFYSGEPVDNKRIHKVLFNTNIATTFSSMYEGSATYDSAGQVIYVWLTGGVEPNNVADMTDKDYAAQFTTTLGYMDVSNLQIQKGRISSALMTGIAGSIPSSYGIHDCVVLYGGVDGVGAGSNCIGLGGGAVNTELGINAYAHSNTIKYCLNNAVEISRLTNCVIYNNYIEDIGGNVCEVWEDCSGTKVLRNFGKDIGIDEDSRLTQSYHASFVWVHDDSGAITDDTHVVGNVGVNIRKKGVHIDKGSSEVHCNILYNVGNRGIDIALAGTTCIHNNNIILMNDSGWESTTPRYISLTVYGVNALVGDNNIYHGVGDGSYPARWSYDSGASFNNVVVFATYQAGSGNDAAAYNEDPLFSDVDNDDFSLLPASSGLGSGNVYWGTGIRPQAFNGELFDTYAPDIGGYQLAGSFYP